MTQAKIKLFLLLETFIKAPRVTDKASKDNRLCINKYTLNLPLLQTNVTMVMQLVEDDTMQISNNTI